MRKKQIITYPFKNLISKNMNFNDVFNHIVNYMVEKPSDNYRLILGTDSQVHKRITKFVTGIVILREGDGAWACIREVVVPRRMTQLHERISFETSLTEEISYMFTEEHKNEMINIILPHVYKGSSFAIEGHIDIGSGKRNKTREFVREMVSRIESVGMEPKIKPDSFVASAYANRFTKSATKYKLNDNSINLNISNPDTNV